jgi:short chain dehydrogenase
MNHQPRSRELSWAKPLSVDLLLKVLNVTFLHPFVAWMVPLCMRAQAMKWTHPAIQIAIGYASLLTALHFLDVLNRQIAFSKPRKVDFSDEVIVVTGGASGLGLLIAEVYGMRGATVAVLDVKDLESGEARGVSVYKCDVGDKDQVAKVAIEIERDVRPPSSSHGINLTFLSLEHQPFSSTMRLLSMASLCSTSPWMKSNATSESTSSPTSTRQRLFSLA